jgi:leader peptidase (prepilin peptidase) / N-methyltransferase
LTNLNELPPAFLRAYAIGLGLAFGSFLNVVIHRVPRGMSVVHPRSHCPSCGGPIAFYDNIPLFSYLWLRGRARCCRARISPRYFLIELLGGLLSWAVLECLVLRLPPGTSAARGAAIFVSDFALALGLVAAAFIDLEHMYIPDAITLGGCVVGIVTASFRGLRFVDGIVGALVGFAIVWIPFSLLYRTVRGRTGMGLGDAKLVALAGAWFGIPGAVFSLLAGAVQGTVGALLILLIRGTIEEPKAVALEREQVLAEVEAMSGPEREAALEELAQDPLYEPAPPGIGQARLAFGPFLVLAVLEYLLGGQAWVESYIRGILGDG